MMIFVCGLSKSGKSCLIESVIAGGLEFEHVKASSLLRDGGRPLERISAHEMLNNQATFLRMALAKFAKVSGPMVIDGHLLIETTDGPQLVPDASLRALPLAGIVLVEDAPGSIAERRRGTWLEISTTEIADLVVLERDAAKRLARQRSIEFSAVNARDIDTFANTIRRLITR